MSLLSIKRRQLTAARTWLPFAVIAASLGANSALAQQTHTSMETVVVTGAFEKPIAETMLPVNVLTGADLAEEVSNTLGDTLSRQMGVTSSTFGNGVGLPVIRGQSGNRVQVLQDAVGALDAAAVSPDHNNGVEPILAERIEVVRGPATLLYGNGAIGGVVNVIDGRVPATLLSPSLVAEQRYDSRSNQHTSVVKLSGSVGQFGLYLDGFVRDSDDLEIDGLAIDVPALGLDAEEAAEIVNSSGKVANSDVAADSFTVGASYVGDRGYIGYAVSKLNNQYGLPPGVHAHEEEEGHDEEHEGEEEEQEFIRLDMVQTRQDVKAEYRFDGERLDTLKLRYTYNDYEHRELEIGEEGVSNGTLFSNKGSEVRATLSHQPVGGWRGLFGVTGSDRDFSAIGEEAYIPESAISHWGVFAVEEYRADEWALELGLRLENQSVDPAGNCKASESSVSAGVSVLRDTSAGNVLLAYSRSQRSPTVEEYFSNISASDCAALADDSLVLHAATDLFEVGNPDLDKETSNNIELAYRQTKGMVTGEISAFYNRIDDYIALVNRDDEIADYLQRNAKFSGIEVQLDMPLISTSNYGMDLAVFADYVRARFDDRTNIPRIPPMRYGAELSYHRGQSSMHVRASRSTDQQDAAVGESATDGFMMLDAYAEHRFGLGNGELLVFLKARNLLDETIRNHTSFVKNFSPEGARSVELGVRLNLGQ